MATLDIKGLFENNRRKEASAVTMTLPAKIKDGELRTGTPDTLVTTGDVITLGTLPAGIIVTNVCGVVLDVMDAGTFKVDADTVALFAALDGTTVGLTQGVPAAPFMVAVDTDIVITATAGPTLPAGSVKIVIEYITIEGNTMSYLGEA